jgi:hypothetical protein
MFLLVEGPDDERFCQTIIAPLLRNKYDEVRCWLYAGQKSIRIAAFLESIKCMKADYIYFADINNKPCVTAKKNDAVVRCDNVADSSRVVVVIREMESWYLAGLDDAATKQLKLKKFSATDAVTKEKFDDIIPKKFDSRIDFMIEVLKSFSWDTAKRKNKSFNYFAGKFLQ